MEYPLFQPFLSHDAIISNFVIVGTVMMAVTLVIGAIWLIYSSLDQKYRLSYTLSRRVDNLYVKINYRTAPNQKELKTGFLLSLGMSGAAVVIRESLNLQKGSYLYLYFNASEEPSLKEGIAAKITKIKQVHSDPLSFQLELQFAKASRSAYSISVVEKSIMQFSTRWNR